MIEPLLEDLFLYIKTPEIQTTIEKHVLRPIISKILSILYPYLLGILLLWAIMFTCLVLILFILIRGSLGDIIKHE